MFLNNHLFSQQRGTKCCWRTDAEAVPLILWPPDSKNWLIAKDPWCWERLKAGEGDNRGWDGWMASPMGWTWVWVGSGSWWSTGKPGVLQSMGSQSQTQLSDWTELNSANKLNAQSDDVQPWCTPFPIWNQSVVPGPVLTVASWPAYRFLRRQVRWSGISSPRGHYFT